MKKIIFTTLSVIFTLGICFSQDVITKKSGEDIQAKVLEVGQTEIKYKKFDNQDGPAYTILKSDVFSIKYENGSKDIFNAPTTNQTFDNNMKSNNDSCLIIIYRERLFTGSIISYNLYAGDKEIARIKNGNYYEFKHAAGEVEFWAKTEVKESIKITLKAGETYYLECSVKFGALVGRPSLMFVDKFTADQKIANLEKSKNSLPNELSSNAKPKQRPFNGSIYLIGGKGFKSSDAYISGGGGIGFDASLGYNFSKSFGITADIGWQKSFGNDPSGDVDMDFTRWQLLLTPKLLLPINNKHQFNLGGGLGLYCSGYNFFYASYDDNLSIFYKPALGFHALCEYKYHINNWLSVGLGAKYTAVSYKADYVSDDVGDDIPVSYLKNEYKNFKGNGLDFYAGLSINF